MAPKKLFQFTFRVYETKLTIQRISRTHMQTYNVIELFKPLRSLCVSYSNVRQEISKRKFLYITFSIFWHSSLFDFYVNMYVFYQSSICFKFRDVKISQNWFKYTNTFLKKSTGRFSCHFICLFQFCFQYKRLRSVYESCWIVFSFSSLSFINANCINRILQNIRDAILWKKVLI